MVDVEEFHTSMLCCHCNCELAKVRFGEKEINNVLCCSNNVCGITIDHDTYLFGSHCVILAHCSLMHLAGPSHEFHTLKIIFESTIDHDVNSARNIYYVIGEDDSEREMTYSILPFEKLMG